MERHRRASQILLRYVSFETRSLLKRPYESSIAGQSHIQEQFISNTLKPLREYNTKLRNVLPYSMLRVCTRTVQGSRIFCLDRPYGIQGQSYSSAATYVQRNPSYSTLNSSDITYFRSILGDKNVVQDEDRLLAANMDWMRKYKGSSQLLLLPKTTEEVSKILSYCNSRRLAVVPQGGNTGLVGGSVPVSDEVIISMASMDKIISFDKVNGILTCEAGCILENLTNYLTSEG